MSGNRPSSRELFGACAAVWFLALPALAQEEAQPGPADTLTGLIFRWLNLALVLGALVWVVRRYGRPYFEGTARAISSAIRGAAAGRASAERKLAEATKRLASVGQEIQEMRRAALTESENEGRRLRALAKTESEKIAQAAAVEIEAAERVARQQLRAIAARLATERAEALLKERMSESSEQYLFGQFVAELERSAR